MKYIVFNKKSQIKTLNFENLSLFLLSTNLFYKKQHKKILQGDIFV